MENIGRQRIRKTLIILSFVLLPATFAYISCPIITQGASVGIVTGGLVLFILLFVSSLFLGRLWCGWLCPAGGLQEIYFDINNKPVIAGKLNRLKYIIFLAVIFIPSSLQFALPEDLLPLIFFIIQIMQSQLQSRVHT
jgi:polyferredoxin